MSSMALNLAPYPTFMVFGKSKEEQLKMLDSISFAYLFIGFITNLIWLSYGILSNNNDIAFNNALGKIKYVNK